MTGGPPSAETDAFVASRALFGSTLHWLDGAEAAALDHAQLETQLQGKGRELLRQLFQDSMDLRAHRERPRAEVVGADAVVRARVESGHTRALTTVFGEVSVSRMAYRAPGRANLHPADAELTCRPETLARLRRLAAIEAARGSFDDTVAAIDRYTGVGLGKRQLERLAVAAAADFDDFYAQRTPPTPDPGEDPKHQTIVAPSSVRACDASRRAAPGYRKAADTATTKLRTRLSKGEKRNRKRLAEIGAVYHAAPVPRTAADILADSGQPHRSAPVVVDNGSPQAHRLRSLRHLRGVREADRRSPIHQLESHWWTAPITNQRIQTGDIAAADINIMVGFIPLPNTSGKRQCFQDETIPAPKSGRPPADLADTPAQSPPASAAVPPDTGSPNPSAAADACANYLTAKAPFLDFPNRWQSGWPSLPAH